MTAERHREIYNRGRAEFEPNLLEFPGHNCDHCRHGTESLHFFIEVSVSGPTGTVPAPHDIVDAMKDALGEQSEGWFDSRFGADWAIDNMAAWDPQHRGARA